MSPGAAKCFYDTTTRCKGPVTAMGGRFSERRMGECRVSVRCTVYRGRGAVRLEDRVENCRGFEVLRVLEGIVPVV